MIISIIGNCQGRELSKAISANYKNAEVKFYFSGYKHDIEAAGLEFENSDIVISQWFPESFGPIETAKLKDRCKNFVSIPVFTFTGFHPDIVYVKSDKCDFASPLGANHSRIIVASYLAGIPEHRVSGLFNSYIYRLLGYFDEFEKSSIWFDNAHAKVGLNIATADLAGEPFMHTINHPTARMVYILGRAVAEKAGLDTASWDYSFNETDDGLKKDIIWPIYPELAKPLGLDGSLIFKPHDSFITPNRSLLSLDEMISESYEKYRSRPIDIDKLEPAISILKNQVRY